MRDKAKTSAKELSIRKSFVGYGSRHLPSHIARQILAVIIVALDDPNVFVPREPLHRSDVPAGRI
jgi:hypothetical protein